MNQSRTLTKSDVMRAYLETGSIGGAADLLAVSQSTVYRTMRDHNLVAPRSHAVDGQRGWQQLYTTHGGNISAIARAMCLNRTYITRELERYGIRQDRDQWAEEQVA